MKTDRKKTFGFLMLLLLAISTAFAVSACDICDISQCDFHAPP